MTGLPRGKHASDQPFAGLELDAELRLRKPVDGLDLHDVPPRHVQTDRAVVGASNPQARVMMLVSNGRSSSSPAISSRIVLKGSLSRATSGPSNRKGPELTVGICAVG